MATSHDLTPYQSHPCHLSPAYTRASTTLRPAQRGLEHSAQHKAHLDARTITRWLTWRHLRCKILETPDFSGPGWTLLQLEVIAARDVPCPLTHTGYLAHGIDAEELALKGGAEQFFADWMDREAQTKAYQRQEFLWRQRDLILDLALIDDESREA